MRQNLSENWLVAWKMTRNLVNFRVSSWKSENLHLMDSFSWKDIKFYMKSTEELLLMTLASDAKFEEKLVLGFKNDMTNLLNFDESRNLKIFTLMCYFFQYHVKFQLKNCRRVISHDTEEGSKLWRKKLWFFVWKITWEIWCDLARAVKNWKIWTLMGYFCQKYVIFELN